MLYQIYTYCPYEGIEEEIILEHEKTFTKEELDKMVKKALINCAMEKWLDDVEKYPEEPYFHNKGYWKEEYIASISLQEKEYTEHTVDKFLINEYDFKEVETLSYGIDSLTKIKHIMEE